MSLSKLIYVCLSFVLHNLYIINADVYQCSALSAYIQENNDPIILGIESAQTLFPPLIYNLSNSMYEGIILNNTEDICDMNQNIMTDINNKILIVYSGGNCSEQSKVLKAQNAGAVAVLIINSIDFSYVYGLKGDNSSDVPRIPARMITKIYGDSVVNRLNNLETVMFEFKCYNDDYPEFLCIFDGSGNHWYTDGQYIRNGTYNGHPIYYKEGYPELYWDLYVWLYTGDGTDNWHWVMSPTTDTIQFVAKCNDTFNIYHPGLCSMWYTDNSHTQGWQLNPQLFNDTQFIVSEELCPYGDEFICMKSDNYDVGGILGTYRKPSTGAQIYEREFENYDETPGFLLLRPYYKEIEWPNYELYYGYLLYDPTEFPNFDVMAYCEIGKDPLPDEVLNNITGCYPWNVIKPGINPSNGNFHINNFVLDTSVTITNGFCDDWNTKLPTINTTLPDKIYACDSNIAHGYLENEWILNGTTSDGKGIWTKIIFETGLPIYLWFYSSLNRRRWIITTTPPNSPFIVDIAYCPADTESPLQCLSCWYFYFEVDWYGKYYADCYFHLELDNQCTIDNKPEMEPVLCIESDEYVGSVDIEGNYYLSSNTFEGNRYYIQETSTQDVFIYYYNFGQEWIISTQLGKIDQITWFLQSPAFSCSSSNPYEIDCDVWASSDYTLETFEIDIHEGTCEDKALKLRNKRLAVGFTTAIIVVIILIIIMIAVYIRRKSKIQTPSNVNNSIENNSSNDPTTQITTFETIKLDNNNNTNSTKNPTSHTTIESASMDDITNDVQQNALTNDGNDTI